MGMSLYKIKESWNIPGEIKELFNFINLKKVEVSRINSWWILYIELSKPISMNNLLKLKECFLCNFKNIIKDLKIEVSFKQPDNLAVLCSNYWQILIEYWNNDFTCFKVWNENISYKIIDKDILEININNRVGLDLLSKKGFAKNLRNWFKVKFNLDIDVKLKFKYDSSLKNIHFEKQKVLNKIVANKNEDMILEKETNYSSIEDKKIIFGNEIKQKFTHTIKELKTEEDKLIVKGKVFNIQNKELKKFTLITFNVTDKTDSITVKIFVNDSKKFNQALLKEEQWVKLKGRTEMDRFSNELVFMANSINTTQVQERNDNFKEKRIELHLHTKMSALDALTSVEKFIVRLSKWGHEAVAITDHGNVQAFPEAYEIGKKHNIKIIYGVEGYLCNNFENKKSERYHIVLLAKNDKGLKNLYKLITLSHLNYFYRKPLIPKSELIKYREGLIIGSACEAGELIRAYLNGISYDELIKIASFYDYLEIQPIGNNEFLINNGTVESRDDLITLNKTIYKLAHELNKLIVATGDVHFLDPEDAYFREILMAGQGYSDEKQPPLYLKTTQEMLDEFKYLGEKEAEEVVIKNPKLIEQKIEELKPIPEELYPPSIPNADKEIEEMAVTNAKKIYGDPLPEIVEKRLKKELDSIINNGFAVLYLIAHKLVKKSNKDGYLVGSRGSVGSSFVATMTGITEVNPLSPHYICPNCKKIIFVTDGSYDCGVDMPNDTCDNCGSIFKKDGFNIPFEVFLGFKGDKVPDIDLNFSGEYQPVAHKYTEELFGKDYVFRAGTISTIAKKTAFGFAKNYCDDKNLKVRNAELERLVNGCTGVKRTTGQHPGGLMVVPQDMDIHQFTPLQRPADDQKSSTITTHFDYHAISSRLVKLDILGHDDPTVIKMLEDLTGENAKTIPLDDPDTMKIFSCVDSLGLIPEDIYSNIGTFGIPEFGTRFVRGMLEETKPKSFSELVRISGFSHGTDVWLNNAQDLIKSGKADLMEAIACRDDIMTYLILKGLPPNKAFKIMEDVRKGRGLKDEYIQIMKENNVPNWYLSSCKKIKYMFPKAHAVAYVVMAFRIAYFKVHFPEAFYATFFSVKSNEFDADLVVKGINEVSNRITEIYSLGNDATAKEKNELIILEVTHEMLKRGINLLRVDLEKSLAYDFVINSEGLLPPFNALQGLGETAAKNIVGARTDREFKSKEDLQKRAKLTKVVMEVLENHGVIKGLPATSQIELFNS